MLWYERWSTRLGVRSVWFLAAIGLVVAAVTPLVAARSAPIGYVRQSFEPFVPYLVAVGLPLWAWILEHARSVARTAIDELGPHLRGPLAVSELREAVASAPSWAGWGGFLAMVVWTLPFHELNTRRLSRFAAGDWNLFDIWVLSVVSFQVMVTMQSCLPLGHASRVLGRVGAELDLELFSPGRGRPLGRFSLSLLAYLSLIGATAGLIPGLLGIAAVKLAIAIGLANLGFFGLCLLLAVGPFVHRMRMLKAAELERVERAIAGDRGGLAGSPKADRLGSPGLLELLAYRRELESLRCWPIELGTWGRVVFYGMLPPLSWVGGALVEQLVSRWIMDGG